MQEIHVKSSVLCFFFFLAWITIYKAHAAEMGMQYELSRKEFVRLAGYGEDKLSSVLVMGNVICESCMKPGSELLSSYVIGAKIAVACKTQGKRSLTVFSYGTTDSYGEFMIDLPSQLHAIPKLEDACRVKVLRVPRRSPCNNHRHVLRMSPKKMRLSSVGNSIRMYTVDDIKINYHKMTLKCLRKKEESGLVRTW